MKARYERILLKMSGEALLGDEGYGIGPGMLKAVARDLIELTEIAVQVALVIGGGNIFRGAGLAASGMERVTADQIGMLGHRHERAGATGYPRKSGRLRARDVRHPH